MCRIMSLRAAPVRPWLWIAVQPMTRSTITIDAAQFLGELGALVHVLHRRGGDVQVAALDLAGRRAAPC
jgi:hypothetical protein